MSKSSVVNELFRPARKNFLRRRFMQFYLDNTWQTDLVEMTHYAKHNKGFKYILICIDIFSKFANAVAMRNKTGLETSKALQKIFEKGRIPEKIQYDEGKEFLSKHTQDLLKKHSIKGYSTFSSMKCSIVERYNIIFFFFAIVLCTIYIFKVQQNIKN